MKLLQYVAIAPLGTFGVLAPAYGAAADQYLLAPNPKAGHRWSYESQLVVRFKSITMLGNTTPGAGYGKITESAAVTVVGVDRAGTPSYNMVYGLCIKEVLEPLQDQPTRIRANYANQEVQLRKVKDRLSGREMQTATIEGRDADGDTFAMTAGMLLSTLMPPAAIGVGDAWESAGVGAIFGDNYRGQARLQLADVQNIEGRPTAIIAIKGRATAPGKLGPTIIFTFDGKLEVDLAERIVTRVALTGRTDAEHRDTVGNILLVQHGDLDFGRKTTLQEPLKTEPEVKYFVIEDVKKPADRPGTRPATQPAAGPTKDQPTQAPVPAAPTEPAAPAQPTVPAQPATPTHEPASPSAPAVSSAVPSAPKPAAKPLLAQGIKVFDDGGAYEHADGSFKVVAPAGWIGVISNKGMGIELMHTRTGAYINLIAGAPTTAADPEALYKLFIPILQKGGAIDDAAAGTVGGRPGHIARTHDLVAPDNLLAAPARRNQFHFTIRGNRQILCVATVPATKGKEADDAINLVLEAFVVQP